MKILYYLSLILLPFSTLTAQSIKIQGVMDLYGSVPSGDPDGIGYSGTDGKAIHLKVLEDISDLSVYSIDVISNGSGSLNPNEYILSGSANSGDDIFIYRSGSRSNFNYCIFFICLILRQQKHFYFFFIIFFL